MRTKYETTIRNIIRKTVQESYLFGNKIVTRQISDISTNFVDFISVTDVQNIQQVSDRVSNQFWKTSGRLHLREQEFIVNKESELELKPQFDIQAAMLGLGSFATFNAFNTASVSKLEQLSNLQLISNEQMLLGAESVPMQFGIDTKVMFLTSEDAKVDPEICSPLNRQVYDSSDPDIPDPPLHNHCRCLLVPLVNEFEQPSILNANIIGAGVNISGV